MIRVFLVATILLAACAYSHAAVQVGRSFPEGILLGGNEEECTIGNVGMLRYNDTADIVERCGNDLLWRVIGLGASSSGEVSTLPASELQNKVLCSGHGVYDVVAGSCQCYEDAAKGFHSGERCHVCTNGMERVIPSNPDYPCVVDVEAPVLTLIGESVITIVQYTEYIDEGASVSDNVDGTIFPAPFAFDMPFNASIPDVTYTITYTYTDSAGNAATPLTRTVVVERFLQDECVLNLHNCDVNAICTDTIDSFTCTCKYGYTGDGVVCMDYNECSVNNGGCHSGATCSNSGGGFSCSCTGGLVGDGVNCAPIDVYCNRYFEGGHWALVRRASHTRGAWGPWNDNAVGTASVGSIVKDPHTTTTWTVPYSSYTFTNMLFTAGDYSHWVIVDKNELSSRQGASASCDNAHNVIKSGLNSSPHSVQWCNRGSSPEDPWISEKNHGSGGDSSSHSMVYGENHGGWAYYRNNNLGGNVFIQSEQLCPDRVYCASSSFQGGGWALVRRVSHNRGSWGPWDDGALGTTEYGSYVGNPTHDSTFSLPYAAYSFEEMLFATGDFQYWVRMNKTELTKDPNSGAGCFKVHTVTASHVSPEEPYDVEMCNRPGSEEDPWVSARDHTYGSDSADHSMLYGEDSYGSWSYYRNNHFGANVFIRNFDLCPLS